MKIIRSLPLAAAAMAATMMLAAPGMAAAATAPSHPDYAAEATSYQNATLSAALARAPGGMRISPNTVEWNDYTVMMTVPATPDASTASPDTNPCWNQYSCVYNAPNQAGTRLQFQDAGYYQDLYTYGGPHWQTLSWRNRRPYRAWLNQYKPPSWGHHVHAGIHPG